MLICVDMMSGTGCGATNRDGAQRCAQCGRPLRYPLRLHNPGDVVGRYRIGRVLGHGGFGAVYQADDLNTGAVVAVKETLDPDSIRNFQSEFAILRNLQHPNLPRYFEMFEEQGNGYLAMELVPGQSLEDVLDKQPGQPLIESQVLGYAVQICDALTYLHSQTPPILHRDIKPANVRLTPEGLVKLVDFGLVKQGTGATGSSRRGLTPAYAPIEQWGNLAGQHTGAFSDVYALGATLYHLLTAQEPIAATDRLSAPNDPVPPVNVVNSNVSAKISNAVMTALSVLPQNRFATAEAFKQALLGNIPLAPTQMATHKPQFSIGVIAGVLGGIIALCVIGGSIAFMLGTQVVRSTATPSITAIALAVSVTPIMPTIPKATPMTPTATPVVITVTPQPTRAPTVTLTPNPAVTPTTVLGTRAGEERMIGGAPMVFVPAGDFTMGNRDSNAPEHVVYLDDFWIDKLDTTNALYKKCVDAGKCAPPSNKSSAKRSEYYGNSQFDNFPVIYVSWDDASKFCAWAGKRLPTEAEWEKAARGTDKRTYPWGNTFDANKLNSAEGGRGDTTVVGFFISGASPYGALDLAGNVWEWVADWYDSAYYTNSPRNNPVGPAAGDYRVLRGGSWSTDEDLTRAAYRGDYGPGFRFSYVGFRCSQ